MNQIVSIEFSKMRLLLRNVSHLLRTSSVFSISGMAPLSFSIGLLILTLKALNQHTLEAGKDRI